MATCIGNVIRILDEFTILIDAGVSCVSVGDTVQVYQDIETIYDLAGNSLGDFSYIKDELSVIQVSDNFSVCRKNESYVPTLTLSPLLQQSIYVKKKPLSVNPADFSPLPPIDKTIHLGDKVKKR